MKDYLESENARNKQHAKLYERLIKLAFGHVAVLVTHHIIFDTEDSSFLAQEMPSADCLIFDHNIMGKVFGEQHSKHIMRACASVPSHERDHLLEFYLNQRDPDVADLG